MADIFVPMRVPPGGTLRLRCGPTARDLLLARGFGAGPFHAVSGVRWLGREQFVDDANGYYWSLSRQERSRGLADWPGAG